MRNTDTSRLRLRVRRREQVADDVVMLELESVDSEKLPEWEPGAHLDMTLPSGLTRQYSLCGDHEDHQAYTIAVLREAAGRGGSEEIHQGLVVGTEVSSHPPRNHFGLIEAPEYVLIAGGIGITPIKAMVEHLERQGKPWRLFYGGRTRSSMAFVDHLGQWGAERVTVVPQDVDGLLELNKIVSTLSTDAAVYCCGPAPLLTAVQDACEEVGLRERLHFELFTPPVDVPELDEGANTAFDVELRASGVTLHVAADQTILEVVQGIRPDIAFSCQEGYCGSCESDVIDGVPDHRGTLMTPEEHDADGTMLICVGRCLSATLVLDL